MIRFKCIYCGQRILAPDDGVDKKGKCPKCNHLLVVPFTTKGRPAISPNKEPIPERPKPYVPAWDRDVSIWGTDPRSWSDEPPEELIKLCRESFGFLIPTYDKLSLFLTAVTLILLLVTSSKMRNLIQPGGVKNLIDSFISNHVDYLIMRIFAPMIFISLVAFVCRASISKKSVLLLFAVLINVAIGFISGRYIMKNSDVHNWQIIFPIWNIINGALLLLMLRFRIIDEDCISDRKATPVQIILGLMAVLVIFILCNYVFKLYWAITFSICIVYTTSFDRALQNVFPGLAYRENKQA